MSKLGTIGWDGVADSDVLNKGLYQFRFAAWKEKETRNGKLMIAVRWIAEAPEQYRNMSLFENFVVGSDDHPDVVDPASFGTRELKKTAKALHVELDPDVETTLNRMLETSCILSVDQETYEGRVQNKVADRYALGDREPSVEGVAPAAARTPLAGRPSGRRATAAKRA